MCGIIGYLGKRQAVPILLDGLQRLEYRGYDSAGLALVGPDGQLQIERTAGKLSALREQVRKRPLVGTVGLGHTRWATHGKPSVDNAHPHTDCSSSVALVHNGIVENYLALRRRLLDQGHRLRSETDSELVAHLIESQLAQGKGLEQAVQEAMGEVGGSQALVVLRAQEPDKLLALRTGNAGGITVGYGQDGMLVASDLPALLPHARKVVYLDSREMAVVTPQGARYLTLDGVPVKKQIQTVSYDPLEATKGKYEHFMLKEIMEQPEAVLNAFRGRVDLTRPDVFLDGMPVSEQDLRQLQRVVLVGMGTSYHAALVGRSYFEQLAQIPTEVDNASEFRYRSALLGPQTLVVPITQSGETVDTLMCMEEARRQGARQVAICNVSGSQASRLADYTLFMRAGPEIGVASTKTLTSSITALYLLALYLAKVRGTLSAERIHSYISDLTRIPHALSRTLERSEWWKSLANQYFRYGNFLYLGRGICYPVALEGALKLKEISYIHAEGYPAGEMKHGPIALIDESTPVVALALRDGLREKMISTIEQVRARDGKVIAVATDGDEELQSKADHLIYVPEVPPLLSPLVCLIPLQLFAYSMGVRRGHDVDQPRNLAKSVTVE